MCKPVTKIAILNYIKVVYKVLLYSGLIHFKYNATEGKCKCSLFNRVLSQIVYRTVTLVYGIMVWWVFCSTISYYINFIDPPATTSSAVEIQDTLLNLSQVLLRIVTTYLFTSNYLKRRHCLLTIANEMLGIFHQLTPHTDSLIYFDSRILHLVIMKTCLTLVRLQQEYRELLPAAFVLKDVLVPYSYLVMVAMNVTCIGFQLTLICFYSKMYEFLTLSCRRSGDHEISRYVRKFIAVSNRIHRVKKQLDDFYTILFIGSYIGMLTDIYHTYRNLQVLMSGGRQMRWLVIIIWTVKCCPGCVTVSFDVYLLGRLSDILAATEEAFKRRVMELIDERGLHEHQNLQRAVELLLHQDWLRRINTLAFEKIHLDQQYAFAYFLNVIVVNVITFLQYYASNEVYRHKRA